MTLCEFAGFYIYVPTLKLAVDPRSFLGLDLGSAGTSKLSFFFSGAGASFDLSFFLSFSSLPDILQRVWARKLYAGSLHSS